MLIGLAALLRILHIWNSRSNPTFWALAVDPEWYDLAAQKISMGDWGPFPLFRAPAYPTLLGAVYSIFGRDLVAARLLNIVLQGATIWAVWRIGKTYFKPAIGVIAAFLLAINGTTIYFAGEILSTSLEMLVGTLGLWATLRLTRDRRPTLILLCGFVWGIAAITRPNNLFIFPVALVIVYFTTRNGFRNLFPRQTLISVALWIAAAFLPIIPVTAANYLRSGEFVLIATQGGVNFWIGNNPESTGILSVLPGYGNTWTMEDAQSEAENELGRPVKPSEVSAFYYAKGWKFLAANPLKSILFIIHKTALFFNRFEISNNKHIVHFAALSPWLPPLMYFNFGILIPFGLLGWWIHRKQQSVKFIAAMSAVYIASVVLFFVTARFRLPVIPWFSLLAAGGIWWIVDTIRYRFALRAFLPALLLIPGLVITHIDVWGLAEAPDGWARYMEGNAYLKLNQLDSARACFNDAIRDDVAVSRAQINLGLVALRQGDTSSALYYYESSRDVDSSNADVWNNLGTLYEAKGDTTMAFFAYRKALALRPWAPDPRHNLAGMHFRIGVKALKSEQDSVAERHLLACIALEATAPAYYNLAVALGRQGRNDEAIAQLDNALQLDPQLSAAIQLKERLRREPIRSPKTASPPVVKSRD